MARQPRIHRKNDPTRKFVQSFREGYAKSIKEALASANESKAGCHDCGRPYGDEHGFPDLIIATWAWKMISPAGGLGGLLCPSCICARLHKAGLKCPGSFMSGPVESTSAPTMEALNMASALYEDRYKDA